MKTGMESAELLEVLGTLGAGGTGLVGIYLLIKALWKMVSGQLTDQRSLLKEAREGTSAVVQERDSLQLRVDSLRKQWDADNERKNVAINALSDRLDHELTFTRKIQEYASHLRSKLIEECRQSPDQLPPYPTRTALRADDSDK